MRRMSSFLRQCCSYNLITEAVNVCRESVYCLSFLEPPVEEKERQVQEAMLSIKEQFGKNSILRASSLQEEGTMRFRNTLVGGHNGE